MFLFRFSEIGLSRSAMIRSMRLRRATLLLVSVLLVTCVAMACSGGGGGGDDDDDGTSPTPTPTGVQATTASLSGAVTVAIQVAAAFGPGTENTLVAVDSAGNVTVVLSSPFDAQFLVLSSTHLLVVGQGTVLTEAQEEVSCTLLAIPLEADGDPVLCVNTFPSGGGIEYPGVATRGSEVFFTLFDSSQGRSELRRWDGVATQTELLLSLTTTLGQPFASADAPNVCVARGSIDPATLRCSDPGAPNWVTHLVSPNPGTLGIGRFVLTQGPALDLLDQSIVVSSGGAGIPYPAKNVHPTPDGGFIGLGSGSLWKVRPPPAPRVNLGSWQRFLSGGAYGYAYANNDLRRVDVIAAVVGSANLLGASGLLEVTGMWFSTEDRIRIDGTGSNGLPTSVLVDLQSGAVTTATSGSPAFSSVFAVH